MSSENMTHRFLLLLMVLAIHPACGQNRPSGEVALFDFETVSELDQAHWHCHTLMSLSNEHVTHGLKSLHLELHPRRYSEFSPILTHSDWHGFSAFAIDVFNPGEDDVQLVVRIDDREDQPEYEDRVNWRVTLTPGPNAVTVPLDGLMVSGKQRMLNTRSIQAVVIYMVSPKRRVDLYLDYGRLIPAGNRPAGLP